MGSQMKGSAPPPGQASAQGAAPKGDWNSGVLSMFMNQMMGIKPRSSSGGMFGQSGSAPPPAPKLGNAALDYFKNRPQAGLAHLRPQAPPGQDLAAAEAWKARYGSYPSWFKG